MKVAGWICVQPANLVFEMLCPQIGTNLRKSFTVPTLVGTRTDIIEALAKPRAWEGQRPRCPYGGESRAARTLPLPVWRRISGNEDVAPPGFCKCLYNICTGLRGLVCIKAQKGCGFVCIKAKYRCFFVLILAIGIFHWRGTRDEKTIFDGESDNK